ncbi:hypothetical protein AO385_1441 [Moraxella catarrhalis]|uniref:Uncharacterized protein n=1 Tax=Moraxella catarrhalis TaxID=480 RepID=A0A198UGS4_MORCA|nr:hypothetical protein AO384_1774 [Moraxella catarrhalis]OAU94865.1 hypothetical protein AO383_2057 [Moraxella catarrhalis]OAU99306.1 hypothetical protein AO385_1441 [Moraxella catarrhalis]OAV02007.1 hypothetical protein AO382_0373 [Moraxella catarrhalis]
MILINKIKRCQNSVLFLSLNPDHYQHQWRLSKNHTAIS